MSNELANVNVLVTRSSEQAKSFSQKIIKYGGESLEIPLISVTPYLSDQVRQVLLQISNYNWLVFTSANGVKIFFKIFEELKLSWFTLHKRPAIAVVGKKTAQELERFGIKPDIIPSHFDAFHLSKQLIQQINANNETVLLVRGNLARPELPQQLQEFGLSYTDLVIYKTGINQDAQQKLNDSVLHKKIDFITFTSPSTVDAFTTLLQSIDWKAYIERIGVVCIGPVTREAAEEAGFKNILTPNNEYTIDAMLKVMIEAVQENKGVNRK